ncbi:glycine--tRNA ligase subunit beta [Frateuria terrea]|uniref:Glycine--tRNA ligase beta subunit n=1 Tax=Frateuria terrea TaxID=529704 RepID=A0A1H6XCV3_9GAMM|nr:glycine--tRNA ligase subunit beta [Frateuria terrea]SEJ26958.1 glycyl-tRNA synthetase beta chain [Frateuria terrea]SFP60901.1 glycyl-tRNA synthetase beta chain [Frateuria terrea]
MSAAKSLLIELGTEELPPKALDELSQAFLDGVVQGLAKRGIEGALDEARAYCSPRRLAVYVPALAGTQPEQHVERRGPAVNTALDAQGQPSKALIGFAQSCGVDVAQLEKLETDKGAWFVFRAVKPGQSLAALLPEIVEEALKGLPIPRPMRWADHDYAFVRPAHWLVMLHGAEIIDGEVLGLKSGRKSRGHRFMHPNPVHVTDADGWLDALRAAKVLADPRERRERIRGEVARAAAQTGGVPRLDEALLDEIANLTEWPAAIACAFEREFLAVPPEALVTTMETNQKFVPVFDAAGVLTEHFIGIANIESKDPAEIRKGYERVIRPRFADAKFFWDEDLKTPLGDYQGPLKNVTYQQALGSLWDKSVRVAELARVIAARVDVDAGAATRAASLSKCDLLTRMVGEFPELQGVMGRYYAQRQGEGDAVARALDSYYQPRFAGDAIAADKVGQVLAVAERLDTLAGIFAVGMKPSGNKDPFALRRAALGLARTLVEAGLELDLRASFAEALELLPEAALVAGIKPGKDGKPPAFDAGARRTALLAELVDFVVDRLRGYYAELGFTAEQFEAVLAVKPDTLPDFDRRLRAVAEFGRRPEAASLAAANKRVANILRKAEEETGVAPGGPVDPACFESPAEHELTEALDAALADTAAPRGAGDYTAVLARLAQLQAPVDAFFDSVLVNAEDPRVRANRLALLASLKAQFAAVADIARL